MAKRMLVALIVFWTSVPFDSPSLAQGKPSAWKQPMTSWGEPDLRGIWPLNHLISTPFQRPEKFGERRFLTDEEFAAVQKSAEDRNARFQSGAIPQADAGEATRLTSLMVDPPHGRFPELTAKGKELYERMRGSYKPGQTVFDSPEDFDSWDRCITRGLPVSMLPRNYNNGIRIMQFPGYMVIVLEMAHETRIIPTTQRPALDESIRQYLGESRGRWEGNTLVVDVGRRDDELQREDRDDQPRGARISGADSVNAEPAVHRALHAHSAGHDRLSNDRRGSGDPDDRAVVRGVSDEAR